MSNIVTRENALQKAAEKLDIAPAKYKQAMERFDSVRSYLLEGEYDSTPEQPEVYLQGSFRLGTEIRPYKDSKVADYDIDIVCCLKHRRESIAPKVVKHLVGDHLKSDGTYKKMLDKEGRRCWTINYAEQDGVGFHLDILPSVQESGNTFSGHNAIAVTNKDETGTYGWSPSNPSGFARWFYDKNNSAFERIQHTQKQVLFERHRRDGLFTDQKTVPDIHVKTPLQRAIQLLKRHRDIRFCGQINEQCKPISMVITVLAAHIYRSESTIDGTLKNLIGTLSRYAEQAQPTFRFSAAKAQSDYTLIQRTADGKWYIQNPTNHQENFADKWHENDHARAMAFFQWVEWAREDFINIAEQLNEEHYTRSLVSSVNNSKSLTVTQSKALTFDVAHRQKPLWYLDLRYSVQLSGRFKSSMAWQDFSSGDPLEKHCKLSFHAETNVAKPFDVYWQVINTGKEAESAGQLRGQIVKSDTDGAGGLKQTESTAYTGTHCVECFIVKDGVCVARSGEFIVRIV